MNEAAIATYYDRLSHYVGWARLIGFGGGADDQSTHRALAAPDGTDAPSPRLLEQLLIERLGELENPRVLDAGCGMGGTILRFAQTWGGRYDGLTLSAVQRERAHVAAAARGFAANCRFQVRSYDDPPEGPYDVIVAIESLAHSPDAARSVGRLARVMAAGGRIVIVDDVPMSDLADDDRDLLAFRAGWMLGRLPRLEQWRANLESAGLNLIEDRDLTSHVRPRSLGRIRTLSALNRSARALIPFAGARAVLDSHLGGLALERLYRRRAMTYRLMIARRQ